MAARYTREEMMEMDPLLLRMHLRERVHHTVEHQLYSIIYGDRKVHPKLGDTAREILRVWEDRGLPRDLPDIKWIYSLMDLLDRVQAGEEITEVEGAFYPERFSDDELATVDKLITTRRSFRQWKDKPVPQELIDEILEAAMWAPTGCNLEILRFIIMDTREELERFHNIEFGLEQVKIVACIDRRPYDEVEFPPPAKNALLDVGAAMQTMALKAHALGLGGCWSTFSDKQIEAIHDYYNLPDYIQVMTYLSLGWPTEKVLPPLRMGFKEAVLNKK